MSLLIYADDRQNVILRPEVVQLAPELGVLNEDELLYVILVYDYFSIYRQFPEEDRIRKAMIHVWNDNNPKILTSPKVNRAIEVYKSLQYNPKIEQVAKYQKKIEQMLEVIDGENSVTAIKNARDIISGLRKDIIELESEVAESVRKQGKIKGNMERSWLEEIMDRKAYYEKIIAKK